MDISEARKQVISGERIYLRHLTLSDVSDAYLSWLNDSEVTVFMETKHSTMGELQAFVKERISKDDCLFFGIFDIPSNRHIGNIKLEPISLKEKKATIGIMLGDKSYWGKSFGYDSLLLCVNWVAKNLPIDKLYLGVLPENKRAFSLYKKIGFTVLAIAKKSAVYEDGVHDNILMELDLSKLKN
ncbi:MAG: GNAT family N-acetyltransferase [Candidatus Micrarchaeia archaeon]|jgi:RimJ/RimL family protein N-acetyltransferase